MKRAHKIVLKFNSSARGTGMLVKHLHLLGKWSDIIQRRDMFTYIYKAEPFFHFPEPSQRDIPGSDHPILREIYLGLRR